MGAERTLPEAPAPKKDQALGKTYLHYAPESAVEKNEYKKPRLRNQTGKRIFGEAFSNSSNRISIDNYNNREAQERKALTSNRMYKEESCEISSELKTQELDYLKHPVEPELKNKIDQLSTEKRLEACPAEDRPELEKLTYKPTFDIDSLVFKRLVRKPKRREPAPDHSQDQSSGSHPKTEEKKMNSSKPTSNAKPPPQMARLVPNSLTKDAPVTSKASPKPAKTTPLKNPLFKPVPRLEVDRVAAHPADPNDPNAAPETSETVKHIEYAVDRMIEKSRSRSQNRLKHR